MLPKNLTAFIFARGGSKGIKNKNIALLSGKPMISYTILCALKSTYIDRVIVSTDNDDIARIAIHYGASVLQRPDELAQDNSPEILSWKHAIEVTPAVFQNKNTSIFVSLPATSPLRSSKDIDNAIENYMKKNCDIVFGVSPSHRSPYLNMVNIDNEDLINIAIPGSAATRRQDVPPMYDITTCCYVSNPEYILTCKTLMDGRVGYIIIPPERAIDIDTPYDLYLADLMLSNPFNKYE